MRLFSVIRMIIIRVLVHKSFYGCINSVTRDSKVPVIKPGPTAYTISNYTPYDSELRTYSSVKELATSY